MIAFSRFQLLPSLPPRYIPSPAFLPRYANNIYTFCFPTNTIIYPIHYARNRRTRYEESTKTALSLARTCQQIRTEVIPVYFGKNIFSFSMGYQIHQFMNTIGRDAKEAIQQLQFTWRFGCPKQYILRLRECLALHTLRIGLNYTMTTTSRRRSPGIWQVYGPGMLEVLRELPRHLDLKIREVSWFDREISGFFNPGHKPTLRDFDIGIVDFAVGEDFDVGVVQKFEARLKKELGMRQSSEGKV